MDFENYLRRVPKVELHCHFEGTVRPQTSTALSSPAASLKDTMPPKSRICALASP